MKISTHSLVLGLVLMSVSITTGAAQTLLNVQFLASGSPSQSGFNQFDITSTGTATDSFTDTQGGSLSVTIFGASGIATRFQQVPNGTNFTNGNLFSSFVLSFLKGAGGVPTLKSTNSLEITGLVADTTYQIQIWSVDPRGSNNGKTDTWYDTSAVTGSGSSLTGTPTQIGNTITSGGSLSGGEPDTTASNNLFSAIGMVTTNGSGDLFLADEAPNGNSGILNGFSLSEITSAPEPSVYVLMLAGMSTLFLVGRYRVRS